MDSIGQVGGNKLGIFEPIGNLADQIILGIAQFALNFIAQALRIELKLKGLIDAKVQVSLHGKLYYFKMEVEAVINGVWVSQYYECEVYVPFIGVWECKSYKLCQPN